MEKEVMLTREGLETLKEELAQLQTVRRKEVSERLKVAIDFGDLSENSEYDDAKNEQAYVEGRIKTLEAMLRNAIIIEDDENERDINKIFIGAKVRVLDVEMDEEEVYRIVGTVEADPMKNRISNESPLGKALLGHAVGEVVEVDAPVGKVEYKILAVEND